jgi:TonB-linked SusC/RagA family outer membrane protein
MKKNHFFRGYGIISVPKWLKIMKLLTFFMILGTLHLSAVNSYSQTKRLNLKLENSSLIDVFKAIEEQSEFTIFYKSDDVAIIPAVNLDVRNKSVTEALNSALKNTGLSYSIQDKVIVILSEERLRQQQEERLLSGIVKDALGDPIPGVTVSVKGTTTGTITDIDGNFSMNVPENAEILVFSFVGMRTQEVPVGNMSTFDIVMQEDILGLDEVVVVGYGTQKKINLTGAVGIASDEDLESRPLANLGQGLQGVVSNLQVNQDSYAPGQGTTFNIRGMTSINESQPLVLIDGVVQDPNLLNPSDVESVSVLKDAASAAIYGARAAYGVILITTKSGKKKQRPTFNVSSSYSVTSATNIPKYSDSWEYITYMNTASKNAGGSNYFDQRLMDHALAYYEDPGNNMPVYYDPGIDTNGKYNYCGNTDWADELYKNGAMKQVNASISGGTERSGYYISYGFMEQNGLLRSYDDYYRRHNVAINFDTDVLDWLSFSTKVKYTYSEEDHPSGGSNGWSGISEYSGQLKNDLRPLMPVKHPDGSWAGQGSFTNPFAVGAEGGYDQRKVNDFWLTGAVKIKPLKGLNINVDYTFNPYSWNKERTSRLFKEYWAEPGKYNIYPWVNPNSVALENNNDYYHALNGFVDYTKSINNHNFKVLVGYNHEKKHYKWFYAKRENLIDNDLPAINRAIGEDYVDGSITSWAVQGVFSRINYDYKGKYLLELNGRYDGSSKFPEGDRFAFFPSFSAGWRMSEEPFWEGLSHVFNDAKLRVSYGSLGNQYVESDFPYISSYNIETSTEYIIGDERPVSLKSGDLVSPNFTWEKVNQWNVGVDLAFFDSRLGAAIDVYQRNTIGMLQPGQPLPSVLGASSPRENSADLKTYGWESTIRWKQTINDFSYNVSLNISDSQSEITDFDNPSGDLDSHYTGQKIGEIWGFETDGLFQTQSDIDNHADQSELYGGTWNPGDVMYRDISGDNEITRGAITLNDHGDLKIIGNETPRYQFGLNIGADWKGFDMNMFFQGVGKRDLWLGSNRFFGIGSEWDVPMKAALNYWTEDNTNARLPRPYINGGHGNRYKSTLYLQDASYIRLKQLTVGYTIPEEISRKASISNARFYFTAQNLFTITGLSELYDPENTNLMNYPVPKLFSFGVNLTF